MIIRESYEEEHIRELQSKSRRDPQLIERALYAMGLIEALTQTGMKFIFKGGSCLMVLLPHLMRLSTDIDIIVDPGTDVKAIAEAMVKYADSYPAPASFKKRMRANFVRWLEAIRSKYEFPEQPEIPWALYPEDGEKDTVIGMLQSLQSRRGVTKEELQVRLGIGPRAILKDLCKLDPTLREDGTEEQETPVPFYIGGQPVRARIRSKKYAGDRKKYYLTENSVHPLILQENLFQAATLLQALQRYYDEHESTVSSMKRKGMRGIKVWGQSQQMDAGYTQENVSSAAFENVNDRTG